MPKATELSEPKSLNLARALRLHEWISDIAILVNGKKSIPRKISVEINCSKAFSATVGFHRENTYVCPTEAKILSRRYYHSPESRGNSPKETIACGMVRYVIIARVASRLNHVSP
jgi:hypothetical protein